MSDGGGRKQKEMPRTKGAAWLIFARDAIGHAMGLGKKLSGPALAEQIGLDGPGFVHNVEAGNRRLSTRVVEGTIRLAREHGVTLPRPPSEEELMEYIQPGPVQSRVSEQNGPGASAPSSSAEADTLGGLVAALASGNADWQQISATLAHAILLREQNEALRIKEVLGPEAQARADEAAARVADARAREKAEDNLERAMDRASAAVSIPLPAVPAGGAERQQGGERRGGDGRSLQAGM